MNTDYPAFAPLRLGGQTCRHRRPALYCPGQWLLFCAAISILLGLLAAPGFAATIPLESAPAGLTVIPTPTGTPTPLAPADWLREGLRQQHNGNHAAARAAFTTFLSRAPRDPQAADALFHLGESFQADGLHAEAITAFQDFLRRAPTHARRADAQFHLGQAQQALAQWEAARSAYQDYLKNGSPWLAYDVYQRLAEIAAAQEQPGAVTAAYQAAVSAAPNRVLALRVREQWAAYATGRADFAGALAQLEAILTVAQNAPYQAEMHALAGDAAWSLGQRAAAEKHWRTAIALAPSSSYAYQALIRLVDNDLPVDAFTRGQVDYENGAYQPAINALETFLAGQPGERRGAALALSARSYQGLENYPAALATWDRLLNSYPNDAAWASAWLGKAETQRFANNRSGAIATLRTFVQRFPKHAQAPDVLLELARQLERSEDYRSAASYQALLADSFPQHKAAANALLRAGINRYRLNEVSAALTLWQRGLKDYPAAAEAPTLRLWLGKGLLAQRKRSEALTAWQAVVNQTPESYAGQRARTLALQAGLALTVEARFLGETGLLSQSDDGSRAFAERWLRTWAKTGSGVTDLARLDQRIGRDQDWQRGQAYLALRLRGPALEALELVRTRYWNDPLLVYQLALAFEELGTYRLSVISAARVIALAPGKSVSDTPIFIQRLAYPQHFADLVAEEATRFAVDPLLVYAMIRQESLFEPGAESSAAARGLMQVIPSTGRWIAGELGMLDFQESDLYRPWISVKFGVFYTMRGLRAANGNVATALTGYNAGPGNAKFWRDRSGPDEDLFYETISIAEPRAYLSLITAHLAHYTRLYGSR